MKLTFSRTSSLAIAAASALLLGLMPWSPAAQADTAPVDASTPSTVSADPLPTVQINGVAWTQKVVGNTVYVGGNFTSARPAGSAAGSNETARSNLLAYDIRTGNLITAWAPTTNGEVNTITASPDGKRIYVGGTFTTVNGQTRSRIAALDPTTGATITAFQARADARVRAIVATSDTVYFGGLLSQIDGVARSKVGAVRASDGAILAWQVNPQGGSVHALALTPDGTQLLVGGNFTTMNGSSNPGYGLASVSPTTGALLPWAGNGLIRNGGANAAITAITTDADSAYVSGFVFGSGGNLEGVSRMSLDGGAIKWVEDCHGDTYGTFPQGDRIYVSSHAHYCGNLPDGFPQTDPWTQHYGTAFTKATTGTLGRDPLGYYNYEGTPSPTLLKWIPLLMNGKFTGQGQAGWNVVGTSDYVAIGGEFPTAGGQPQQGLVRYAVRDKAPNKIGPEVTQSKFNPTLASFTAGKIRIAWQANWDRDNENLTYQVIRDGNTAAPIYQTTLASSEWTRPQMGFVDTGLVPGRSYRYRVFAKDPLGNEARSDTVTITAAADGQLGTYGQRVVDDGASAYYRLGESSGSTVFDWAGFKDATASSGVTRGTAGAIAGDTNTASSFDGTANGSVATTSAETAPNTFTTESWVKTTSTSGGKIVGYGGSATGTSGSYDRHVYMGNDGKITFGVYPGTVRTITSPESYNDGQWHHVVSTLGADGMALWIDGRRIGTRSDTTSGQAYAGYWRIGGDNTGGWPNAGSSNFLNGSIDDVSIYPKVLSAAAIRAHYTASGRDLAGATAPADSYGKAVYDAEPDLYWRANESQGTTLTDSSPNASNGTLAGGAALGAQSGIGLAGDTSAAFNGSDGTAATNRTYDNPTTYSEELWFNTTTTRGGKLIGFSSDRTGGSGGYDRHVYMFDDGRLRFGTYTGVLNTIDTNQSYNDGTWHHMVATQSSAGMRLYVDGQLAASGDQTGAQNFTGYWRIGGDTTWGGNSSNYFDGRLDEVAVYPTALDAATVQSHFTKGGGRLPNVKPVAAFTSSTSKLKASFDGSGSTDSDGTVASYAWTFGDGGTATTAKPDHTYTQAGTYPVTLTVTDDRGASDVKSANVTVTANAKPAATFTSSSADLKASFDGSGSTDSDGTVASYAWTFGDGGTATTAKPDHTYTQAGTYTVTLTVTDDDGATDVSSKDVVITGPANVKPVAAFTSSANKLKASFDGSGSTDSDGTVASYAWTFGDGGTATTAKPDHTYTQAGTYPVTLTVTDDRGASDLVSRNVVVSSNVTPLAAFTATTAALKASFDGSGSTDSDGTVVSYAWTFGDGGTATTAKPDHTYTQAGTYPVTLTVTDDDGGVGSIAKDVTVSTAPVSSSVAADPFGRSESSGWGSADTGGTWTRTGAAALFSVADGAGKMRLATAGQGPRMTLGSVSARDVDATVDASFDKIADGGGAFASLAVRSSATGDYRAKVKVNSTGTLVLYLTRTAGTAETALQTVNLPSTTRLAAGESLRVRLQATGTGTTTLRARVWKVGSAEPTTWQASTTDTTTSLQTAGGVALVSYLAGTVSNTPVVLGWDNLQVVETR
ncbi:MAG: PKD domain-containing protein [Nocardioidaceae bacterium]|nr:PKD domain-containing protein [Nocardioidaceae bacterium]